MNTEGSIKDQTAKTAAIFISFFGAFNLLAVSQILSAFLSPISDCDEVYNFWEPLHLLVFGRGLQTWEYSPVYALRSYAYIIFSGPHFPIQFLAQVGTFFEIFNKLTLFYVSRCILGVLDAWASWRLYVAISRRISSTTALIFLVLKSFGTGSFIAGTAFLPSSFAGCLLTFSYANFLMDRNHFLAVFQVALMALLGWPFAAILGLPFVLEALLSIRKFTNFLTYSVISGSLISLIMLAVDSYFYGRLILAPLNIVKYNLFGGSERNSELYGTEPWTFYALNLFLNWNFAVLAAVLALPVTVFSVRHGRITGKTRLLMLQAPLYAWMAIFWTQAHKEERFLFPIYPLVCFSAAFTAGEVFDHLKTIRRRKIAVVIFLVFFVVTSVSRTAALVRNYKAPLDVYAQLAQIKDDKIGSDSMRICVGKEWYRFPSSFFLPGNSTLNFVRSNFDGILPSHFAAQAVSDVWTARATRHFPAALNDLNLEEPSRYVDLWTACDFLVDLDRGLERHPSPLEPNYVEMAPDKVLKVFSRPFLLTDKSHRFFRAFYVPYFTESLCVFGNYNLLKIVSQ